MTQKNESNYLLVKALLEGGGKGYYLLFWYYLMETDMKVRFQTETRTIILMFHIIEIVQHSGKRLQIQPEPRSKFKLCPLPAG